MTKLAEIPPLFWTEDCIASPDDQHRLWLARETRGEADQGIRPHRYDMAIFLMCNPSLARGEGVGDPTQRKLDGFAARLRAKRYGAANLFTRSTPYPKDLFTFGYDDAIGPQGDAMLRIIFSTALRRDWPIICAWGKPSLRKAEREDFDFRVSEVQNIVADYSGLQLYHFARTDCGQYPRHPLMLGYDQAQLRPWIFL